MTTDDDTSQAGFDAAVNRANDILTRSWAELIDEHGVSPPVACAASMRLVLDVLDGLKASRPDVARQLATTLVGALRQRLEGRTS